MHLQTLSLSVVELAFCASGRYRRRAKNLSTLSNGGRAKPKVLAAYNSLDPVLSISYGLARYHQQFSDNTVSSGRLELSIFGVKSGPQQYERGNGTSLRLVDVLY